MSRFKFNLSALLLFSGACGIWLWLIIAVSTGPGIANIPIRHVIPVGVLCGVTIAIHTLVRNNHNAWTLSAFLAGLITSGILLIVASLNFVFT
jgi:hypothetical protein